MTMITKKLQPMLVTARILTIKQLNMIIHQRMIITLKLSDYSMMNYAIILPAMIIMNNHQGYIRI